MSTSSADEPHEADLSIVPEDGSGFVPLSEDDVTAADGPHEPNLSIVPEDGSGFVPLSKDDVTALFDKNYKDMCRRLRKVLWGDPQAAQDAAMDAFVSLFERRNTVRAETAEAYLWRIAINRAHTIGTRATRGGELVDLATRRGELPGRDTPNDEGYEKKVELGYVRSYVNALPDDQRTAIVLHYFCDLPDKEIARILCKSETAIRSRIHQARKALKRKLEGRNL